MAVSISSAAGMPVPSVTPLLRPRSIGIIGASADPISLGGRALAALERFAFDGDIYLINPKRAEINGRPCLATVDDLPEGVDAVLLAIPQAAILDTVAACIRRKVKSAVVFSSGFAETGEEGIAQQTLMAEMARAGGLALVGPNCLGIVNYGNRSPLTFGAVQVMERSDAPGLAIVAQSGGIMGCLMTASEVRGLPLTYGISTGNEAVLSVEDFLGDVIADDAVQVVAMFVEQLRQPAKFLALAAEARLRGKSIVLVHSGRSVRSQEAARSHTGAMASNYAAMQTLSAYEGVLLVDGMDELIDTAELLIRFPKATWGGTAIITDSGAFKGLALDFAEAAGLDVPELADATKAALGKVMPEFTELSNPLDVTGQGLRDPATFYGQPAVAMAGDPAVGAVMMSVLPGNPKMVLSKVKATADVASSVDKPLIMVVMGGESPFPSEVTDTACQAGLPFLRSPEHAMRALAHVGRLGGLRATRQRPLPTPVPVPAICGHGTLAEYRGKSWLRACGIATPEGALAVTVGEACTIAGRIGYPVVLKAQAAALPHKSDVGGVAVGLKDEQALCAAWATMRDKVGAARPGLKLDGILVEKMGAAGLELVMGVRRDPQWGLIMMLGLGGVWVEALKDVAFLPATCDRQMVVDALNGLKGALMLKGWRGSPAVDLDAVADVVVRFGEMAAATPQLVEADVNPLVAYPVGQPAVALDALIVLEEG